MVAVGKSLLQFLPMQPKDVPTIAALEQKNYEFPWSEKIFADCVASGYQCVMAVQGDHVMGYGILQIGADEAHILNLCIDRPFQKQGYARRLLEHLMEISRAHKAQMMFLEVRPSNPRAISLYANSGFNEIGTRRDYYDSADGREDAVVMARTLIS
ncbi:MAG: ribosomal protein S18-alanine N-acetyltransferase [Gammaproteobacteria bacterium]|nr:ribosomal protein S18-alanine N-acetyltransferase [Gammaproteobacteria bacterium]